MRESPDMGGSHFLSGWPKKVKTCCLPLKWFSQQAQSPGAQGVRVSLCLTSKKEILVGDQAHCVARLGPTFGHPRLVFALLKLCARPKSGGFPLISISSIPHTESLSFLENQGSQCWKLTGCDLKDTYQLNLIVKV